MRVYLNYLNFLVSTEELLLLQTQKVSLNMVGSLPKFTQRIRERRDTLSVPHTVMITFEQ